MAKDPGIFRVRLNCVDHYQANPGPLDPPLWGAASFSSTQRSSLPQVPVIRVFGSTETGQKVCAHIHGAYPYLFIPYSESLESSHVDAYISTLRQSIDHGLALSYRRNPYDNPRSSTFVAHISLVKGVPFFGYNVGYNYYLKIYLLNPAHMTRFADLLQQGAILKRSFQPYEAHLQYLLQWMCDFNLYGCAYIDTSAPHFRMPVPSFEDLDDVTHLWHDRSVKRHQILDETQFPRQSHCQLELDIRVEDVLNHHEIKSRPLHHSFIERLKSLEGLPPEEKLVHSMAGLWKDETRRRKRRMGLTDPSSSPFPPEVLVSMSADPRVDSKGGWIHEEEFRAMVDEHAKQERKLRGGVDVTFESFVAQTSEDDGIQTVLASVEELFQETLMQSWNLDDGSKGSDAADPSTIQSNEPGPLVDASSIERVADDVDDYGSDEEIAKLKAMTQSRELKASTDFDGQKDHTSKATSRTDDRKRPTNGKMQALSKRVKFHETASPSLSRRVAFRLQDVKLEGHTPAQRPAQTAGLSNAMPIAAEAAVPPSGQAPPSSQRSSQSSQGNKLNFQTVKHPHDPLTQLRLSQQNDMTTAKGKAEQPKADSSASESFHVSSDSHQSSSATAKDALAVSSSRPKINAMLVAEYSSSFKPPPDAERFIFGYAAPSLEEVESTVTPSVVYQDAYYSNEGDVPERPREYAGQEFRLESTTLPFLPPFDSLGGQAQRKGNLPDRPTQELIDKKRQRQCSLRVWELSRPPPSKREVDEWLAADSDLPKKAVADSDTDDQPSSQLKRRNRPAAELSQIDGPTQKNEHGFKYSQRKASTSVQHETGYMSIMSLEVFVNTRGILAPDPEKDEVNMVVWCVKDGQVDGDGQSGIVVLSRPDDSELPKRIRAAVGADVQVDEEEDELDLINQMVYIVRSHDPDILTGFEVHHGSWGYLIERARLQYEFDLPNEFSRMKSQSHGRFGKDADRWGFNNTSTVRITGRHTINIWRAMRSELNLLQYTMENVVFHVLHKRIPHYTFSTLTAWYRSKSPRDLAKVLDYYISRTLLDQEILDANELIPRTSEQARLLGVDFFSVFSRGSQFKVESLMFRIAKPESFILVSPSRKQVGAQNALECLPLVMEPQSAFYNSPMLVLDFQSLYPSVMIAYNYCYSTCLGRIVNWRGTNKLGFADFNRAPGLLELVKDKLNIAPNGMMYVRPEMRKSLLAKMLGEILETRVMVKSGMKADKDDKTLQQLLNNRQLALKLIANVTYGYTSASFSGRMPCSEIADSIVQTGRETLERAIALIHSVDRWGAEVVYGDTDSLFVYLKGRSRADAFKIGDEIAKAITDVNPRPVKLKFEKVYHPCVLLAKKRYVGFKYESPTQQEPEFDAKGIETVRRDGTPAEQKIEEKALKLLFRTSDLSGIKTFFQEQCSRIMTGRFSVQDFCFAKEVKLGTYADKGPAPPGALIATKRMLKDPRLEPQYGERVPYVVITGAPGARLFERCVEPERLLYDEQAELDAEYYISKNLIPPLERIFNLVGANVRQWYDEMPKVQRIRMVGGARDGEVGRSKKTMENYMGSSLCIVCRDKLPPLRAQADVMPLPLCTRCRESRRQETLLALRAKVQKAEKRSKDVNDVCRSCASLAFEEEVKCDSRDCPVFYSRVKATAQLNSVNSGTRRVLEEFEEESSRASLDW